jgi:hypothetical protein
MKIKDLTDSELFQSLIEIDFEGIYIDLHNNYDCIKVVYNNKNRQFSIFFTSGNRENENSLITIQFDNTSFETFELAFQSVNGNLTLDNFYRGRFEDNGILKEHSSDGRNYFYLEFYEGCTVELLSDNVKLFLGGNVSN